MSTILQGHFAPMKPPRFIRWRRWWGQDSNVDGLGKELGDCGESIFTGLNFDSEADVDYKKMSRLFKHLQTIVSDRNELIERVIFNGSSI